VSHSDHLLVSVVVDESASLRQTDPAARRVEGIQAAVDSLVQLHQLSPDLDVEVALATFARRYEQIFPWRPLTPQAGDQLRRTAATQLPKRNQGDATDYRQALLGSQKQLDARAAILKGSSVCKATLLFTDGALDVDAETSQAQTQICQPGGIIDSIRQDDIAVVALALFTPGAGVTPGQRDLLRAIAEGRGDATTCGTVPIAPADAQGVYLPATDPAALQFLFARTAAQVAGGTPQGQVTCPSSACPHGVYTLHVDPGVIGVRLIVRTASGLQLQGPTGQDVSLTSASQAVGDAQVTTLRRGALSTFNLSFDDTTSKATRWRVITHGRALLQTYWFWGASVRPITKSVKAGSSNEVRLQIIDAHGDPLSPRTYGEFRPVLNIGGQAVPTTVSDDGIIKGRYSLGVNDVPSSLLLSASIKATTTPSGHALGPIHVSDRLNVTLPPVFPRVSPSSLDFGNVAGIDSRSVDVTIQGSELGPTRACLQSSSISFPGGSGPFDKVTADQPCVDVPKDGQRVLTLQLKPSASADGVARGIVRLRLKSSDGQTVRTTLPATLEMSRIVDQGKRWEIVALLLGGALLIPLLLLIGSNYWLLGRFSMAAGTRTARRLVIVTPSGLKAADGAPLLSVTDLQNVAISGVRRSARMLLPNVPVNLSARRVFSLRAPIGVATSTTGSRLVSGTLPHTFIPTAAGAPVALGRVDATLLAFDDTGASEDEARGELFLVIPPGIDLADAQDRVNSLSRRVDWSTLLHEQSVAAESLQPAATSARDAHEAAQGGTGLPAKPPSWLDETGPSAPAASTAPAESGSRRRRERASGPTGLSPSDPYTSEPPPAPAADERPPLPDFLRDED
jgi:hypothetical protein